MEQLDLTALTPWLQALFYAALAIVWALGFQSGQRYG